MKSIFKKGELYLALAFMFVLPVVTLAAGPSAGSSGGIAGFLSKIRDIIGYIIPLVIGVAVVMFLFGLLKFVTSKDADGHKEAVNVMISGIVVLFVMTSVWGLVRIFGDTFEVGDGGAAEINKDNFLPPIE